MAAPPIEHPTTTTVWRKTYYTNPEAAARELGGMRIFSLSDAKQYIERAVSRVTAALDILKPYVTANIFEHDLCYRLIGKMAYISSLPVTDVRSVERLVNNLLIVRVFPVDHADIGAEDTDQKIVIRQTLSDVLKMCIMLSACLAPANKVRMAMPNFPENIRDRVSAFLVHNPTNAHSFYRAGTNTRNTHGRPSTQKMIVLGGGRRNSHRRRNHRHVNKTRRRL